MEEGARQARQDTQTAIYPKRLSRKHLQASTMGKSCYALEALATGNFAGIGLMLPAPYVLIDKDAREAAPIYDPHTRKIISPLALRLLEQVPSYAELSPNNGLHILTEGTSLRGNFKTEQLEMYTNWFSTVTTRHIPGTPLDVTNQQAAIEALENEFHLQVPEPVHQNTGGLCGAPGSRGYRRKRQVIRCYKNSCPGTWADTVTIRTAQIGYC